MVQTEADQSRFKDPNPQNYDNPTRKNEYECDLERYSVKMIKHLKESRLTGQRAWLSFTATFRKQTIVNMNTRNCMDWCRALEDAGVKVLSKPRVSFTDALIECLEAESFPGSPCGNGVSAKTSPAKDSNHSQDSLESVFSNVGAAGASAIALAYIGRGRFNGDYDFEPFRLVFDTLCKMHKLSDKDKVRAMPVMLDGIPLYVFNELLQDKDKTYEEILAFYYKVPLDLWKQPLDSVLRRLG